MQTLDDVFDRLPRVPADDGKEGWRELRPVELARVTLGEDRSQELYFPPNTMACFVAGVDPDGKVVHGRAHSETGFFTERPCRTPRERITDYVFVEDY